MFEIYRKMTDTAEWLSEVENETKARTQAIRFSRASHVVVVQTSPNGMTKLVCGYKNGKELEFPSIA